MIYGIEKRFCRAAFFLALFAIAIDTAIGSAIAAETIGTPVPLVTSSEQTLPPANSAQRDSEKYLRAGENAQPYAEVHFFPAVLETRRYGPVEEPAPQFYSLRNGAEPGFNWSQGLAGPAWYGYGGPYAYGFPGYGFSFAAYPNYNYRPWYTYPNQNVWSDRLPWYSPGGVGPNIYQPWYTQRYSLPWYSPYGIGPNIYTPSYEWRNYYPWYAPNGPGPNIYTPAVGNGGFYW